ncbi:MAG TPA: organic hydroperoxide resistance protein [Methylibium sp.]|nr:organic hydroperoxide resistance protein [Methylibium sp.]
MTAKLDKVLYTAKAHTTGGRDGASRTDDGKLDVRLSPPSGSGAGTNPEQLFAAGYSACFLGAMKFVAGQNQQTLPADTTVTGKVGIGVIPQGFGIEVDLAIHVPGMARADAEALVQAAHGVCPYSNATRGNVDVRLSVV